MGRKTSQRHGLRMRLELGLQRNPLQGPSSVCNFCVKLGQECFTDRHTPSIPCIWYRSNCKRRKSECQVKVLGARSPALPKGPKQSRVSEKVSSAGAWGGTRPRRGR